MRLNILLTFKCYTPNVCKPVTVCSCVLLYPNYDFFLCQNQLRIRTWTVFLSLLFFFLHWNVWVCRLLTFPSLSRVKKKCMYFIAMHERFRRSNLKRYVSVDYKMIFHVFSFTHFNILEVEFLAQFPSHFVLHVSISLP